MKFHFDCVFYYVSDLGRAVRFYRDVLGFKVTSQDFVTRFDVGGVLFELVPTDDVSKIKGNGNARLCLSTTDIQSAVTELRQKGVKASDVHPKQNGFLVSFPDPDGNEICLWQDKAA